MLAWHIGIVERDRRRSKRVPLQESVSISLGDGSDIATGVSDNVSLGGALFYCDRFISEGSEVSVVIVLPLEITEGVAVQVWCSGKARRIEKELREGKFGIAVEFLSVQRLPRS